MFLKPGLLKFALFSSLSLCSFKDKKPFTSPNPLSIEKLFNSFKDFTHQSHHFIITVVYDTSMIRRRILRMS